MSLETELRDEALEAMRKARLEAFREWSEVVSRGKSVAVPALEAASLDGLLDWLTANSLSGRPLHELLGYEGREQRDE